jgi:hypothetical protein
MAQSSSTGREEHARSSRTFFTIVSDSPDQSSDPVETTSVGLGALKISQVEVSGAQTTCSPLKTSGGEGRARQAHQSARGAMATGEVRQEKQSSSTGTDCDQPCLSPRAKTLPTRSLAAPRLLPPLALPMQFQLVTATATATPRTKAAAAENMPVVLPTALPLITAPSMRSHSLQPASSSHRECSDAARQLLGARAMTLDLSKTWRKPCPETPPSTSFAAIGAEAGRIAVGAQRSPNAAAAAAMTAALFVATRPNIHANASSDDRGGQLLPSPRLRRIYGAGRHSADAASKPAVVRRLDFSSCAEKKE